MLRDVFYYGKKPNVHPREKFAKDLADARKQCTTEHFWVINEFCDYTDFDWYFDFDFLPDDLVWTKDHNNVWPSKYQKDSGTWLCSKNHSDIIVYRHDVDPIVRKNIRTSHWMIKGKINESKFDFAWHPDPSEPPYIYQFPSQWNKSGGPRYYVEGAREVKYVSAQVALRLPDKTRWVLNDQCSYENFDFSWHPDDSDPAFIYQFGTQWQKTGGPQYVVTGATRIKYENVIAAKRLPNMQHWTIPANIDTSEFDFSWHPDDSDPLFIYEFGTQHQKTGGPIYNTPGAIEKKYVDYQKAKALPQPKKFRVQNNLKIKDFDYSWHPDATEEPFVYIFGNQHWSAEKMPTLVYRVIGAREEKFVNDIHATLDQDQTNWQIPEFIDKNSFDFSWVPDPGEPKDFVYEFATVWQDRGGPRYINPDVVILPNGKPLGTFKYIEDVKAKCLPNKSNWLIPEYIDEDSFDFTWHPHPEDPKDYVYEFPTVWNDRGGPKYIGKEVVVLPNGKPLGTFKYMDNIVAKCLPDKTNWLIPDYIDQNSFDFSWRPHPDDPKDYVYEFATNWNNRGGPCYINPDVVVLPNGKPLGTFKYIENIKAICLPSSKNWLIPDYVDVQSFDFSWRPHPDDPKDYVYEFPTVLHDRGGPRYVNPSITILPNGKPLGTFKYVTEPVAKLLPSTKNWIIPEGLDVSEFDFSWRPHPDDPPYIYQFGTQHQKTGGPRYIIEGATEVKYVETCKARKLPNKLNWIIPDNIDATKFDFSWHPDDTEQAYIYQFGTQHQKTGGPRYVIDGATEVKYVDTLKAQRLPDISQWIVPNNIDATKFDFSWHPDETEENYIYEFATQHQKTGGPMYVPKGTPLLPNGKPIGEKKYVSYPKAIRLPEPNKFTILKGFEIDDFDYSWHPDETETGFTYVFGNQHWPAEKMPTITYGTGFKENYKYVNEIVAKLKPNKANWDVPDYIDEDGFDFSWIPDPDSPAYIYEFATVWNNRGGPKYKVDGATDFKYIEDIKAKLKPSRENWEIPNSVDYESWDFTWRPHPDDPPYTYEFATVWNNRGGPKYVVPGSQQFKYVENIKAKLKPSRENWVIPAKVDVSDFDFSWRPHPDSPPYVYQFGTTDNRDDGPKYVTPEHYGEVVWLPRVYIKQQITEQHDIVLDIPKYYIKTSLKDLINEHPEEVFWAVRENINYQNFNFDWRPTDKEANFRFVHVFGSPDSELTQTYLVSAKMYLQGFIDLNYIEKDKKADEEYLAQLFIQPDIFLVDRGNAETQERFNYLKSKFKNVQKTRFFNTWVDTINRCINRSNTELCWILNSELDYKDFNFNYYPNPWQMNMVHVFGTQWSHWGNTYIVNKNTFPTDTKYIKVVEHLKNLNFVKDRRAKATNNLYDIYVIDHGNIESDVVVAKIKQKANGKNVKIVPYENSYLDTIRNIVKDINPNKEHYVWVTSTICDYSKFHFDFICDPFAKDNLHVFPSGQQKFGDTFLLDVNKTLQIIDDMKLLQQYHKINYTNVKAERLPAPIIDSQKDTHVGCLNVEFDFPYAVFQTEKFENIEDEPMCLWADDTKNIMITSTGATRIIVPKEAKNVVKKEFYDYPYIKTASKLVDSKPLDIVFLSNGEKGAEENYEHLLAVTKGLKNRVVRVDGVNGRVNAYHAAVLSCNTPWAFTVFAKLKVNPKFDFSWQPDRLQTPKHYIFHAKNPINGLEYGHQGLIAYNKKLTLANTGKGLDFTLDDPHETIELLSGTAVFNTDEFSTWRTAFREVIKLKSDFADISQERLKVWTTKAKGKFAEQCLQGAKDALEYYDNVSGDIDQLKLSYEWAWLKDYYNRKYK